DEGTNGVAAEEVIELMPIGQDSGPEKLKHGAGAFGDDDMEKLRADVDDGDGTGGVVGHECAAAAGDGFFDEAGIEASAFGEIRQAKDGVVEDLQGGGIVLCFLPLLHKPHGFGDGGK